MEPALGGTIDDARNAEQKPSDRAHLDVDQRLESIRADEHCEKDARTPPAKWKTECAYSRGVTHLLVTQRQATEVRYTIDDRVL